MDFLGQDSLLFTKILTFPPLQILPFTLRVHLGWHLPRIHGTPDISDLFVAKDPVAFTKALWAYSDNIGTDTHTNTHSIYYI